MGYRSDVILAMKDEKFIELVKNMDDKTAVDFFEMTELKKRDNWTLIHFSDVKWHEGFPEVKAVEDFVSNLEEDEYAYHILKKNDDDCTHKGTCNTPFEIRLNRSLDFN